jgi:hypothetical protein
MATRSFFFGTKRNPKLFQHPKLLNTKKEKVHPMPRSPFFHEKLNLPIERERERGNEER